jgi:hypothetical protein
MPCPLPRWTEAGASVGCYPAPLGPSPLFRRVGVHDFTFEACSGFTHVTACRIAQPPKGGLCHEASTRTVTRSSRSSATRPYRQLPGWIPPPLVNRAVGAHVESRTGAVAVPRLPSPLIKPDVRISRIRLSDWLHFAAVGGAPRCIQRSRSTPSFPKTTLSEKRRVPRVGTSCRLVRNPRTDSWTCRSAAR